MAKSRNRSKSDVRKSRRKREAPARNAAMRLRRAAEKQFVTSMQAALENNPVTYVQELDKAAAL